MFISIITAYDANKGIGKENDLPWKLKEDTRRYMKITSGNTVLMGRKTFESIGSKPLPKRKNVIISSKLEISEKPNLYIYKSINDFINDKKFANEKVYISGGTTIYEYFLKNETILDQMEITVIEKKFDCDTFFPNILPKKLKITNVEKHWSEKLQCNYRYETWNKI